jgi:lysophospholipase L1-like esterase
VVNLGISGVTARHAAHRLEYVGALYHPQLVVYGYTLNDIEGPAYLETARREKFAHVALRKRFENSRSALLRAVWPRLVLAWSAFRPLPGSYEWELSRNYRGNPAAWGEVEAALDRIAAKSRELGACALLFIHPRLQDLTWLHAFTPFYRQVAEAGRARGFQVAVGFDALRGERAASLRFSEFDPHPNAEGHRLLAGALRDAIEALPPGCRAARAPGAPRR